MSPTAKRPSGPDWSRDELVLALDVYFRLAGAVPAPQRAEVGELSAILRSAPLHPASDRPDNFRSPASVVMKLMNFRSLDPSYGGMGLTAGSRLDREVWAELAGDRQRLSRAAAAIRDLLAAGETVAAAVDDPLIQEAEEGALLTRRHLTRERSAKLVAAKKRDVLRREGELACEVCGFCFLTFYGAVGEEFIECHHRRPLSELAATGRTLLADLALVCANCHRMIHARRPWLTVEQLRDVVRHHRVADRHDR
jgi:5-methylcytosine-specific restriction protein A